MTLLAALAAALAVLVLGARHPPRAVPAPAPAPPDSAPPRIRLATAAAAVAAWSLAGPRAGPLAAFGVVVLVPRLLAALPTRAAAERDRAAVADVPLLADLVAACVAAGASLDAAVDAAAGAVGGQLGHEAAGAVRAVRLGVPARTAWAPLLAPGRPDPVRLLGAALARAAESGSAPAAVLRAVADDARAATKAAGEAAARRAAVAAVLPLGLCFLPAFVLAGVVPLVAGLLAHAF